MPSHTSNGDNHPPNRPRLYVVYAIIPDTLEGAQAGEWAVAYSESTQQRGPTTHAVSRGPAVYGMDLNRALECVEYATRHWRATSVIIEKATPNA